MEQAQCRLSCMVGHCCGVTYIPSVCTGLPVRWLVLTLCQALRARRRAEPSVPAAATSTTKATLSTCTPSRVVSCTSTSSLCDGLTMPHSVCRCGNHHRVIHGDTGAREQTSGRGGRGETPAAATQHTERRTQHEQRRSTDGCQGKTRYRHTTIPPYHHCVALCVCMCGRTCVV